MAPYYWPADVIDAANPQGLNKMPQSIHKYRRGILRPFGLLFMLICLEIVLNERFDVIHLFISFLKRLYFDFVVIFIMK